MDARESAVFDSGAQISLVNQDVVDHYNLETGKSRTSIITFGQGQQVVSKVGTQLGLSSAQVVDGLKDNLFSPDQLIDSGSLIHMDSSGGTIYNNENHKTIPIYRDDNTWKVWITDILDYSYGKTTQSDDSNQPQMVKTPEDHYVAGNASYQVESPKNDPNCIRSPTIRSEAVQSADVDSKPSNYTSAKKRVVIGSSVLSRYIDLHQKSGHANARYMSKAVTGDDPAWRNCGLTAEQILKVSRKYSCPHCILAKRNKSSIPVNEQFDPPDIIDGELGSLRSRTAKPGEIISFDPIGPISPLSSSGHKYFFLFKDVATGYNHVMTSPSKEAARIVHCLEEVITWYRKYGLKVRIVRTDFENTIKSDEVKAFIDRADINIRLQNSIPYAHWQNAVERDVQTIINGAATLLHSQPWL
jgi:hypothetical protein